MTHGYPIIPDILTLLFIAACVIKVKPVPKEKSRLWFYKDRHGKIHKEVKK